MSHSSTKNVVNAILCVVVALPAILLTHHLFNNCPNVSASVPYGKELCNIAFDHPISYVNLIFFLNVDILFWIISLIQDSTWLIDPYWTIIPVMISHYYYQHPLANFDKWRSAIVLGLVWIWSIRLTHSYFRREEWKFGVREDWRFTDYKKQYGKHWWWIAFFLVYVSQQVLLVGITLPVYTVHFVNQPLNYLDCVAAVLCVLGLLTAYFADTQLRSFMVENELRTKQGKPKIQLLNTGLWYYSRHPNYFGEQLWWWGLSLFAVNLGQWWMVAGTLVNSLCLAVVTVMVEKRMLEKKERQAILKEYYKTTSVLIPWFKFSK